MARSLTPTAIAALTSSNLNLELAYKAEFRAATLRFWTGYGEINLSSDTEPYLGNGILHDISGFSEDADKVVSENIKVTLAGIPTEMVAFATNEISRTHNGTISMLLFNDDSLLVAEFPIFKGEVGQVYINEKPSSSEIVLSYVDRLARLKVSREARYTPESQKALFPGDNGFDYVPELESKRLYWGRPDTTRQST